MKILPVRIVGTCNEGFIHSTDLINALAYAKANGASIVNCSISWVDSPALRDAFEEIAHSDILIVAAAGNDGTDLDNPGVYQGGYPARYEFEAVLAVANNDNLDLLNSLSNYGGTVVDVCAPGTYLPHFPNNYWAITSPSHTTLTGTSFSAPLVAGIAALYRAENPGKSAAEVVEDFVSTSRYVPALNGTCRGNGVVSSAQLLGAPCSR